MSFYCGCLSDLGFKEEGFKTLKAYDLSPELAKKIGERDFPNPEGTYRNNISDAFTGADINALTMEEIPEADFMMFSPPCQGFSSANRQTGFIDNPKNANMRRSINIIKEKQPMMFAIEQVPDMLTVGEGTFKKEIQAELGSEYDIKFNVIDCSEIGSPQKRKRAIVIGSRVGKLNFTIPKTETARTVGEAFTGITDDLFNQEDKTNNRPESIERMKTVPQGGNWQNIPEELRTPAMGGATHSSIYKRLDPKEPSITMTNVRKSSVIHPYEDRGLSVREIARLMDLPDLFEFIGTLAEKQQQLANGIPLNLSQMVARIVKDHLTAHVMGQLTEEKQADESWTIEEQGQLKIA